MAKELFNADQAAELGGLIRKAKVGHISDIEPVSAKHAMPGATKALRERQQKDNAVLAVIAEIESDLASTCGTNRDLFLASAKV